METAIFAACCFAYWAALAVWAVIDARKEAATAETKPRGVSVSCNLIMAVFAIGLGLVLNAVIRNLGYWTIGITHAAYLIWGLVDEVVYRKRNKLKQ